MKSKAKAKKKISSKKKLKAPVEEQLPLAVEEGQVEETPMPHAMSEEEIAEAVNESEDDDLGFDTDEENDNDLNN